MENGSRIIILRGLLRGYRGVIEEIKKNGFFYCNIENWGHQYLRPHEVELLEHEHLWKEIVDGYV